MTKFGDLTETQAQGVIAEAFVKALEDPRVTGNDGSLTKALGGSGSGSGDDDDGPNRNRRTNRTPPPSGDNLIDTLKEIIPAAAGGIDNMHQAFVDLIKTEAESARNRVSANREMLGYYIEAREQFGGMAFTAELGQERVTGLAKASLDGYKAMFKASAAGEASALKFKDGIMEGLDPMKAFFASAHDAGQLFSEVFGQLATDTPRAAAALAEASDVTQQEVTALTQMLSLTDEQSADILRKQFAFRGEVSSDVLGKLGTVSLELHRTTGISANALKEDIISIISDTNRFGDIGVESAGRISAALGQLGLDFQTFTRMTDRFMDFDSAANKMGELSALFGIQMDAMEMTYLANEDQEEFLFRMREEILDSGIDIENMSNARARALANQLNMNVVQMKTFLRDGGDAIDRASLEGATDAAGQLDALTTAGKYFGDEMARGLQEPSEILDDLINVQLMESEGALLDNTVAANKLAMEFRNIKLPEELIGFNQFFLDAKTEVTGAKQKMAAEAVEVFNDAAKDLTEKANETLKELNKGIEEELATLQKNIDRYYKKVYGDDAKYEGVEFEKIQGLPSGKYRSVENKDFSQTPAQIENLSLTSAELERVKLNADELSKVLESQATQNTQIQQLITLLETGKVIQINVVANGAVIAQSMQAHLKDNNMELVLTNK